MQDQWSFRWIAQYGFKPNEMEPVCHSILTPTIRKAMCTLSKPKTLAVICRTDQCIPLYALHLRALAEAEWTV